jgi:hypothetical protein
MVSEGGRRTGGYSLDLALLQMVHVDVYAVFAEAARLIHHGWSRLMSREWNGRRLAVRRASSRWMCNHQCRRQMQKKA